MAELTPRARQDLKRRFIRGLQGLLSGDPGKTLAGQPVSEFLAGPRPSSPLPAFNYDAGRAVCDRWQAGQRPGILPGRDLYYRNLCSEYLGSDTPDDPTFAPPFTGGQCSIPYLVQARAVVNGTPLNTQGLTLRGPLGGPVQTQEGNVFNFAFTARGRGGTFAGGCVTPNATPGTEVVASVQTDPNNTVTFEIVQITRCDGLPDSCGDPPPRFRPHPEPPTPRPDPGPTPGPTGYPFPQIDITIGIEGEIIVDFGDDEDPVVIDPGTDDGDGDGDGGESTPPPGDVGDPGASEETGEDGEASGCAGSGSVLVGLQIAVLDTPPMPNEYRTGIFRGAAYIYMGVPGKLDQDFGGSMLEDGQFFFAEKDNLTCWRVSANSGYNLRVTPYYREVE